jgi:hypothetical protein
VQSVGAVAVVDSNGIFGEDIVAMTSSLLVSRWVGWLSGYWRVEVKQPVGVKFPRKP